MELLDYARFRWKVLAAIFLVGLVAIAVAASGLISARNQYVAEAQLLIRPPQSQLSVFGFNLDRYVDTELATLYSDSALREEAQDTPLSPEELKSALSTSHEPGSDVATFSVRTDSRRESVATVNRVAKVYLQDAQDRSAQSGEQSVKYLQGQIDDEQQKLNRANRTLARVGASGNDANGGDPNLQAPAASSQQQNSLAAIQQARQSLLDIQSEAEGASLSRVLSAANSAAPAAAPWQITTILAAVAGLVLGILALTAIAVAFSTRVVSVARWDNATAGSRLRPAIRGRRGRQRAADLRRIVTGVANAGADGPVTVVPFPASTKRTSSVIPSLVSGLEEAGVRCRVGEPGEIRSWDRVHSNGDGVMHADAAVAVVDLSACRVEDATVLADGDSVVLSRTVPVLI